MCSFRHQCRRHCPQSSYEDWGRGVCLSCPVPCTDCRSNTRCLACQADYFLNGNSCNIFPICVYALCIFILIYFLPLLQFERLNKAVSCVFCSVLSGGECVKECPLQTFSDSTGGRCQPCHRSCQSCHGPHSTDCTLCLSGNSPLHGQCPMVNCPLGQYYDGMKNRMFLFIQRVKGNQWILKVGWGVFLCVTLTQYSLKSKSTNVKRIFVRFKC